MHGIRGCLGGRTGPVTGNTPRSPHSPPLVTLRKHTREAAAGVDRWGLRPGLSTALGQVGTGTLQGDHEGRSGRPPRAGEPKPAARGSVPILGHWPIKINHLVWSLIHL